MTMKGIELFELRRLCSSLGVDEQEIDSSLTYYENKAHLSRFEVRAGIEKLSKRYAEAQFKPVSRQVYNTHALCPLCGLPGSGFHPKWVLNDRKQRFEPYYFMAHSIKKNGRKATKWCYIRKARAIEIMNSYELMCKYGLKYD